MALPRWLRDELGTPTRGRGCRAVKCIKCKADVLAGFDEDQCASLVLADPTPLSAIGEALALMENRRSYRLEKHNEGQALWHRDHWQIRGNPASEQILVFADHKCGGRKLSDREVIKISQIAVPTKTEGVSYDAEPPF